MISKISKLITATLLLAVNFNNSYAINNNINWNNNNVAQINHLYENNMDNVLFNVNQFNNASNNRQTILTYMTQWINSNPQMQLNSQLGNTLNMLQFHNQQMVNTTLNFNTQIKMLYDNVFSNNYSNILLLFAVWDFNMLNKLNNVFNLQQVKQYISQWRIETRLNNEINEIEQRLVNRIQQHGINDPNQLNNEYFEVIDSIFRKYYEGVETFNNTIDNHFWNDNEQQRRNIVNMIRNNLKESFNQRHNYINTLFNNVVNNRNNIINSVQVQNALNQNNVFYQILTNIKQDHEIGDNIKQFLDNYIGDKYDKVSNIFNINNDQELNYIILILQENIVKIYIILDFIKNDIKPTLHETHKMFFKGMNDPSKDNNPASEDTFKTQYLSCMKDAMDVIKGEVNDISERLDDVNVNNNTDKKIVIKDILKQCYTKHINDNINYILKMITKDQRIDNVYQDYLNYYANNDENCINKHMPLPY